MYYFQLAYFAQEGEHPLAQPSKEVQSAFMEEDQDIS